MDIKEQFEEFIKTEEFIFDEKEVAIKTFNFMQAEITRLTALVESYKADAERYNFIKSNVHIQGIIYHSLDSHEIDSYVYQAMQTQLKENDG